MNLLKTLVMKKHGLTVENKFHIVIRQCCASCAHKELTRCLNSRRCTKRGKDVKPRDVCCKWQMSDQLKMAGLAKGRVKCREYQAYLLKVRDEEGLQPTERSNEEIRAEFESQFGSMYINI